jgi:hypothetical protein
MSLLSKSTQSHIACAKAHADPKWQRVALAVVRHLARKGREFTTNDVLISLEKRQVQTHDLRAIGAVMVEAKKRGWIESAGLVRRADKHTRGVTTCWRSPLPAVAQHAA